MRESDIPEEVIEHIKSFTPLDKPIGPQLAILITLFIYYRSIRT